MTDIFISYDHDDLSRAERLVAALGQRGWDVWWDRELLAGPRYRDLIAEALARARCVIVLWSARSIRSEYVCDESDEARERGVLVPVLIEDVKPPHGFRQRQNANLIEWSGDPHAPEFVLLAKAIERLVAPAAAAAAAPAATTRAPARARTRIERPPPTPPPASVSREPGKLYLSYRRDDARAAGRLFASLATTYGAESIALDPIEPASDFAVALADALGPCSVLVLVIGAGTFVPDHTGKRRIDRNDDSMRIELAMALRAGVPVVPVLVENAALPAADDLPEDVRSIAWSGSYPMRDYRWDEDFMRLMRALERLIAADMKA